MTSAEVEMMSLEYVVNIATSIEGFVFEPVTIVYVHSLAEYIYNVMKDVTDIQSMKDWIPTTFSQEFADDLLEKTKEIVNDLEAKNIIMSTVIQKLLIGGATESGQVGDPTVLPWDVKKSLAKGCQLNNIFNISETDTKFGVTVSLGDQTAEHELSLPFVAGILMFSLTSKTDFNVTILGQVLSTDYLLRENNRFQYVNTPTKGFVFEMSNDMKFIFEEEEVLRGFNTGALWKNETYSSFWKQFWKVETVGEESSLVEVFF